MSLFSKELLSYDSHVGQNDSFYYNLPYERNYDLTTSIPIAPASGNIIKFYQYTMGDPVVIFTDTVDITPKKPVSDEADMDEYADEYDEDGEYGDGEERELSEDEMAALLTADSDSEEEIYDKAPAGAAASDEYDDDEVYDKEPSGSSEYDDYEDEEVYDKAPSGAGEATDWEAPEF